MQDGAASGAVYRAIGQRIRDVRIAKRIVQSDVADEARLTRQSVANIERGRQRFMVHTLLDIARALGVQPSDLLPADPPNRVPVDLDNISPTAREFVLSVLQAEGKSAS